jgi:DNA-binding transcriptional LysR family regulator
LDRIEAMSTLLAVVQAGSLSAASRQLGTPLATVSRRISDLEAHLKTRLLNRSTRQISLTDAGATYVDACRHILEQVEQIERAASGEYRTPQGELTVTASMVLGRVHVVPVAADFLNDYPDITLRMRLNDRALDLQQEHVDVAVRVGELPDSGMVARRIGSVRRTIAASPAYLARRGIPQQLADLQAHDCLSFSGFRRRPAWDLSATQFDAAEAIRSRLTIDASEPLVDAAIAGVGIINLFSFHVAAAVKAGRLVLLLRNFEPPPLPVHLVHLGGGLMPLKVRAFLDFAAPRLKARLDADLADST